MEDCDGVKAVNGYKYLALTAVGMVAILLGFIVVLAQFNLMVCPAHITAFKLNTGEKGVCQIEFLGEKAQLAIPDLDLLHRQAVLNSQILTENVYQTLKNEGKFAVMQVRNAGLKALHQEVKFEQLLNTFEKNGPFPFKEWLQRDSGGC